MSHGPFQWNADSYLISNRAAVTGSIRAYIQAVLAYSSYARNTDQLQALKSILGATNVKIIASPLLSLAPQVVAWTFPTGTVYCVAGTTNWPQMVAQLTSVLQAPAPEGLPGNVLSAFGTWADAMYPRIAADFATEPNGYHYWCGHSLGGALALLLAQLLQARAHASCSAVATFGAPRVGNPDYAAVTLDFFSGLQARVVRYCNDGDPVTQLPPVVALGRQFLGGLVPVPSTPVRYKHSAGIRVGISPNGETCYAGFDDSGSSGVLDSLWHVLNDGVLPSPHRLSVYVNRLEAPLIRSGRLATTLPISGGPNGFLPRLSHAFNDLKTATGDTTPIFG